MKKVLSPSNSKKFGAYMRRVREERNLSLREAAQYSNVPWSTIAYIERGEWKCPKVSILVKLQGVYGLDDLEIYPHVHCIPPHLFEDVASNPTLWREIKEFVYNKKFSEV